MTYKELYDSLKTATPQQLSEDVTVLVHDANDEFYPVISLDYVVADDVLPANHLYLMIKL